MRLKFPLSNSSSLPTYSRRSSGWEQIYLARRELPITGGISPQKAGELTAMAEEIGAVPIWGAE